LSETLEANNYIQYEISNWAKQVESLNSRVQPSTFDLQALTPAFACRHNLQYWRGLPYLALGAGAHGYANNHRYSNVLRIKSYIERLTDLESRVSNLVFPLTPATVNHHKQSLQDDMSEFMMTGLRLTQEGVSRAEFQARFEQSMHDMYGNEIEELLKLGLIEDAAEDRLKITKHGRLLGNQVFMRFV
jgi:oxygen-independent coproporphyrinogen III oxidase